MYNSSKYSTTSKLRVAKCEIPRLYIYNQYIGIEYIDYTSHVHSHRQNQNPKSSKKIFSKSKILLK